MWKVLILMENDVSEVTLLMLNFQLEFSFQISFRGGLLLS